MALPSSGMRPGFENPTREQILREQILTWGAPPHPLPRAPLNLRGVVGIFFACLHSYQDQVYIRGPDPPAMNDACPIPLTCFASGTCVRLAFAALGVGECERLGAMGLREGAQCTVLQNSDKLIVRVGESRLGVSREVAMQLFAHAEGS